jgi:DNA-binding transcriptional regulator LsrR (DeoR family)
VKVHALEDWQVFRCCELFLGAVDRPSPTAVARIVSREWGIAVKHTDVYPIVSEGLKRGFARIVAPAAVKWGDAIARRFGHPKEAIRVLAARGPSALPAVSGAAADHILDLILRLGEAMPERGVHVGFVGGSTVMAVAHDLAVRLRHADRLPKLVFHAVCSGFNALHPETAPNSFFGYFADLPTQVDFVGLFAPPVVLAETYKDVQGGVGVRDSFQLAEEIDLVVTSLASMADEHGPLKELEVVSAHQLEGLDAAKAVGDVSYCPFSAEGPILIEKGPRAMTLFQIPELVRLAARKDKHVVLVASPCPGCGRARADALLPLLVKPGLKVWSSVFLDEDTAREIVSG